MFATCGEQVDIWDENRAEPVRSFTWGVDTIHSVKFNPIEVRVLKAKTYSILILLTVIWQGKSGLFDWFFLR